MFYLAKGWRIIINEWIGLIYDEITDYDFTNWFIMGLSFLMMRAYLTSSYILKITFVDQLLSECFCSVNLLNSNKICNACRIITGILSQFSPFVFIPLVLFSLLCKSISDNIMNRGVFRTLPNILDVALCVNS